MNNTEFLVKYVLPDYFVKSNLTRDGYKFVSFELENDFEGRDGFNSSIIFGHIVYANKFGKQGRRESMLIKFIPKQKDRCSYTDVTFSNEIFMYTRIIPFYDTFNNTVLTTFPKFYYATLAQGEFDNENIAIILENLSADGYRATDKKTFLDMQHLLLIVKKLAIFHACSYYAKVTQSRHFHTLTKNLVETHFTAIKTRVGYYNKLNDYFTRQLDDDRQYGPKMEYVREMLRDADKFVENVFTVADEPIAVITHGDFLRNNMMFKYDSEKRPIDVKFFDLACAKYCSPVVDLGSILYMNTDQETRNQHWDELIDEYWTTLRHTFPGIEVPTKTQILDEFKNKILHVYLIVASFLPQMMMFDEIGSSSRDQRFLPEYEEYLSVKRYDIPVSALFGIVKKAFNSYSEAKVLDVLKDMIDRGFV